MGTHGGATSLQMVNELELGVTEPLGVFDPLGWLETQPESFERRRAVERKHGRVCMAAVVGNIVHNNHIVFDGYIPHPITLSFPISQPVSKVSPLYQDLDLLRSLPSSLL